MRLFAVFILFLATPGWADVSATYVLKGGEEMRISYRDSDNIRMQVSAESFMLMKDGKAWMVTRQGRGWMAMDLNQISGMMKGFGMAPSGDEAQTEAANVRFEKTGETETVAGYEGSVYRVTDGKGKTHEMVLTDHADVEKLSRAWLEFSAASAQALGGGMNPDAVMRALDNSAPTGMLRQGDNIRLKRLSTDDLDDEVFALPAGTQVQQMPKMPGMPGGMPGMGG